MRLFRSATTGTRSGWRRSPAWVSLQALLDQFLHSSPLATTGRVHLRDAGNTQNLLASFVIASLPCMLIGAWNIGFQINVATLRSGLEEMPGWRTAFLQFAGIGLDPEAVLGCLVHGLLYFLPAFAVALLVGVAWETLFASRRGRAPDHGVLCIAWLFTLLLPATITPVQVALGMSFAMVVGKGLFGGTGRYLINPAVLGLSFLVFSYSSVIYDLGAWVPVPGYDEPTTIELAVEEGGRDALTAVGYSWLGMFLGNQPGPMGVTSILGCLVGAVYLLLVGAASGRIMLGSCLGLIATVALVNGLGSAEEPMRALPWTWHMVIGGWAFGTVFIATDPTAAAMTNPGRWAFGFLVGSLTIVVRVTNPAYYEGVMFAILLASCFSPLIDHFVIEHDIRRRLQRLEALR